MKLAGPCFAPPYCRAKQDSTDLVPLVSVLSYYPPGLEARLD